MDLLTAVNLILPKLGEHPVTGVDIRHPTLAVILPEIEQANKNLAIKGWWFNQFEYTAYPDGEGYIYLGSNALSFIPDSDNAVVRDQRLYNGDTRSYVWSDPVLGVITELVEFSELPESAALAVMYSALVAAYSQDIGMSQELQAWASLSASAYSDLLAEHLRHRKYTTRKSPRYFRLRAAMRGS